MIKKLTTEDEIAKWWEKKREFDKYDLFPNAELDEGETLDELIEWFSSPTYFDTIMSLHKSHAPGGSALQFVFFLDDDGEYLGFAHYKIYTEEDGKAVILDYCIDKTQRNNGVGATAFRELENILCAEGATYVAINTSNSNNRRFWLRQGFSLAEPANPETPYTKVISPR